MWTVRSAAALAVVFASLIATGCGSESSQTPVSGAKVMACLEAAYPSQVSDAEDDLDAIAEAAGDKGINVTFDSNNLNVAVERAEADAEQTLKSYRLFFENAGTDQLSRVGNVVLAFDKTPSQAEVEPARRCATA